MIQCALTRSPAHVLLTFSRLIVPHNLFLRRSHLNHQASKMQSHNPISPPINHPPHPPVSSLSLTHIAMDFHPVQPRTMALPRWWNPTIPAYSSVSSLRTDELTAFLNAHGIFLQHPLDFPASFTKLGIGGGSLLQRGHDEGWLVKCGLPVPLAEELALWVREVLKHGICRRPGGFVKQLMCL